MKGEVDTHSKNTNGNNINEKPSEAAATVKKNPAAGIMALFGYSAFSSSGIPRMNSGSKVEVKISENIVNGDFPDPLEDWSIASLISAEDIDPGFHLVTNPTESITTTASVAPLGNDITTESSSSKRGHDLFSLAA